MKKINLIFIVLLICLCSCQTKKTTNVFDYDIISVKMNRYEIIDSSAVDSMIRKALQIHKNYTGYIAHNLFFDYSRESNKYYVTSHSSYHSEMTMIFEPAVNYHNSKVLNMGYAYCNGKILLVSSGNFPSLLFKQTDEWDYVMFFSDGFDDWGSRCVFDSSYNFLKSENFAETCKVFFSQDYKSTRKWNRKRR